MAILMGIKQEDFIISTKGVKFYIVSNKPPQNILVAYQKFLFESLVAIYISRYSYGIQKLLQ